VIDGAYDAQVRQRLYEAQQEVARLRGDRDRLELEIGPLRQQLDAASRRADRAEAALAAPCLEPLPEPLGIGLPLGPCVVTGPHMEHRDRAGATWWRRDGVS